MKASILNFQNPRGDFQHQLRPLAVSRKRQVSGDQRRMVFSQYRWKAYLVSLCCRYITRDDNWENQLEEDNKESWEDEVDEVGKDLQSMVRKHKSNRS